VAVSALTRSPVLPDIPTIANRATRLHRRHLVRTVGARQHAAGVVERLNAVGNAALKDPEIVKRIQAEGGVVIGAAARTSPRS